MYKIPEAKHILVLWASMPAFLHVMALDFKLMYLLLVNFRREYQLELSSFATKAMQLHKNMRLVTPSGTIYYIHY